jgi:plasmid stability protein
MGQMLIRNLADAIIEGLRRRAAACGTSTEEQARRALAMAVGFDREALMRELADLRASVGPLPGPSSLEDLRRDRDRDE